MVRPVLSWWAGRHRIIFIKSAENHQTGTSQKRHDKQICIPETNVTFELTGKWRLELACSNPAERLFFEGPFTDKNLFRDYYDKISSIFTFTARYQPRWPNQARILLVDEALSITSPTIISNVLSIVLLKNVKNANVWRPPCCIAQRRFQEANFLSTFTAEFLLWRQMSRYAVVGGLIFLF